MNFHQFRKFCYENFFDIFFGVSFHVHSPFSILIAIIIHHNAVIYTKKRHLSFSGLHLPFFKRLQSVNYFSAHMKDAGQEHIFLHIQHGLKYIRYDIGYMTL